MLLTARLAVFFIKLTNIEFKFSTYKPFIASHNYLSIKITYATNLIYLLDIEV